MPATVMRRSYLFIWTMLFVPGCDGTSGGGAAPPQATIDDAVTDSAALALSGSHLRIAPPELRYSSLASIDSGQAREYATMYLRQFWEGDPSGLRQLWEQSHGKPLDLGRLAPCGPLRLAQSAVLPKVELPTGSRRLTAEYWLVRFCVDGMETAGFIGVSPYSTDIVIVGGQLTWPPLGGAQFQYEGLPAQFEEAVRFSPESAAILAFQCTGRRVRTVPRLILQYGQRGFAGKWELVLEPAASANMGRALGSVDTVYAGYSFLGGPRSDYQGLVVARANQPSTIPLRIVDNIPADSVPVPPDWEPHFQEVTLNRDLSIPIQFDTLACPNK